MFDPSPGPQGARPKKFFNVARPIHVSNSRTKFGWISSNCLGGDSITDGQTDERMDGGDSNIPFTFLKKRGDNYREVEVSIYNLYKWLLSVSFPIKHIFGMCRRNVSARRF